MSILLPFLIACIGLTVEVGGLRAIGKARLRSLAKSIASLERDLGVGVPLDARIAEAFRAYRDGSGTRQPWDGFTMETIESMTDPDVKIMVWPAGLKREPRPRR